jgi:hypothetical protein
VITLFSHPILAALVVVAAPFAVKHAANAICGALYLSARGIATGKWQ